jgi:DTW domain-containing protein YfiP
MPIMKTSDRCSICKLQPVVCICGLIPKITTRTKTTLIVHAVESRKPTNTGILATRCLQNSEFFVRGLPSCTLSECQLVDPDYFSVVLFPSDDATILNTDMSDGRPFQLIVPDGNWKQAKSIPKREPSLRSLPRVTLPQGALSRYQLRREPIRKPHGLATMEAIARALAILEGPDAHNQLLDVFHAMVSRCLWQRGKLKDDQVIGGFLNLAPEALSPISPASLVAKDAQQTI